MKVLRRSRNMERRVARREARRVRMPMIWTVMRSRGKS